MALITGGNATIGQSGALGGLGHFSIGVRVNALQASIPKLDNIAATPRNQPNRQP